LRTAAWYGSGNIYWEKGSSSFIRYDTNLLISYKVIKGKPFSPTSFSSFDSYGNDKQQNLVEVPFAKYDMISNSWNTEANFIQNFPINKLLLIEEVTGPDHDRFRGINLDTTGNVQTGDPRRYWNRGLYTAGIFSLS